MEPRLKARLVNIYITMSVLPAFFWWTCLSRSAFSFLAPRILEENRYG